MTDYIDSDRGRFGYQFSGTSTGPTLVFVAGLGDDMTSWAEVLPVFDDYHCLVFDNRGIGTSPITDGPYTIEQMADDTHAIHQALGLGPTVGIGSSMGGAICQEWALKYPGDLDGVVLTNTWAEKQTFCDVIFEHWQALAARGAATELIDSLLLFCLSAPFLQDHPEAVNEFRQIPVPDLRGFHAAAQACRGHDTLSRLGNIAQPTLVIGATYDILTRPELSERLAAQLPNATLAMVDAAHMIFAEDPQAWQQVLRAWLDRQFPVSESGDSRS
jgi:3-oxoadipate enol-lactonase